MRLGIATDPALAPQLVAPRAGQRVTVLVRIGEAVAAMGRARIRRARAGSCD